MQTEQRPPHPETHEHGDRSEPPTSPQDAPEVQAARVSLPPSVNRRVSVLELAHEFEAAGVRTVHRRVPSLSELTPAQRDAAAFVAEQAKSWEARKEREAAGLPPLSPPAATPAKPTTAEHGCAHSRPWEIDEAVDELIRKNVPPSSLHPQNNEAAVVLRELEQTLCSAECTPSGACSTHRTEGPARRKLTFDEMVDELEKLDLPLSAVYACNSASSQLLCELSRRKRERIRLGNRNTPPPVDPAEVEELLRLMRRARDKFATFYRPDYGALDLGLEKWGPRVVIVDREVVVLSRGSKCCPRWLKEVPIPRIPELSMLRALIAAVEMPTARQLFSPKPADIGNNMILDAIIIAAAIPHPLLAAAGLKLQFPRSENFLGKTLSFPVAILRTRLEQTPYAGRIPRDYSLYWPIPLRPRAHESGEVNETNKRAEVNQHIKSSEPNEARETNETSVERHSTSSTARTTESRASSRASSTAVASSTMSEKGRPESVFSFSDLSTAKKERTTSSPWPKKMSEKDMPERFKWTNRFSCRSDAFAPTHSGKTAASSSCAQKMSEKKVAKRSKWKMRFCCGGDALDTQ